MAKLSEFENKRNTNVNEETLKEKFDEYKNLNQQET